jgi:hypothetical protein
MSGRLIILQQYHEVNSSLYRKFIYSLLETFPELGLNRSSGYTDIHRIRMFIEKEKANDVETYDIISKSI